MEEDNPERSRPAIERTLMKQLPKCQEGGLSPYGKGKAGRAAHGPCPDPSEGGWGAIHYQRDYSRGYWHEPSAR